MALCTRYVMSPSSPAHSSTSLKCTSGSPSKSTRLPSRLRTGGRSALLSIPSTRSLAGSTSLSPCWYWMPMQWQPKSSAMRNAATYILHWVRICSSVRSFCGSGPVTNFMPRSTIHCLTARASSLETWVVS